MAVKMGTQKFVLQRENELRVEVGMNSALHLQLVDGTAEIFGSELPPMFWMTFPAGHKFAVFTWNGCTIEVDGVFDVAYVADETPMVSYANVHSVLEQRRRRAKDGFAAGPRCVVGGPTDHGKSSLARMLLSWAAREGWRPTFTDLDIGQGSITIPGTVSATPVEMPIHPVEGVPSNQALVYFYGHTTPSVNVNLYKALVQELTRKLDSEPASNPDLQAAGMVINTMGWVEGVGYELLLHAIETLRADTVLVLGQEKLHTMLQTALNARNPAVEVVKLHKSGGVVTRNRDYRQHTRVQKINEYFYGISQELFPHCFVANFSDFQVFRLGGGPQAPLSALPIGAKPVADPTRVVPVRFSKELLHAVLSVSFAKVPEDLLKSNVAGFIHIQDVDMERQKVTYMAPCPGPLPNQLLLAGSLVWNP
ncbi:hypothetical protein KC19_4G111200 [Ceratodon purpureus]|uniref:Protein CLP1 homolog n=1 Tax=Ceratodon purpureus TaxID=3225 RepID=A0A8T0I9I0_CERPU|nr:hypothetical protein KC19_4G111200 [Ceratodon purpureus]